MATATTTTTTSSTPELRLCDSKTSATTASMDEAPPQSMLSLSTEASSQINRNNHVNVNMNFNDESTTSDHVVDSPQRSRPVRRNSNGKNNNNHCDLVDDDDQFQGGASSNCCGSAEVRPSLFQQMEDVPRVYMEKLYENTVDGPCQGITMCEVDHLDFFTVRPLLCACLCGNFFINYVVEMCLEWQYWFAHCGCCFPIPLLLLAGLLRIAINRYLSWALGATILATHAIRLTQPP